MPHGYRRTVGFVRSRQRAIIAAVAAGVTVYATRRGFHLTPDQATALVAGVVAVVVHQVSNKKRA